MLHPRANLESVGFFLTQLITGFNVVYTWTDNPTILSGEYMLLCDPHERLNMPPNLQNGNGSRSAYLPTLSEWHASDPATLSWHKHFDAIGDHYDGTIIRIPLRTEAQRGQSRILWEKATTTSDVKASFDAFLSKTVEGLLFVKNIERIEFEVLDGDQAVKYGSIILSNAEELRSMRSALASALVEKTLLADSYVAKYALTAASSTTEHEFVITQLVDFSAEGLIEFGTEMSEHKLLPWAAIAMPLSSESFTGHLFASLPLPFETDQPVHIHAAFAVTSDRQYMRTNKDTKAGTAWNKFLMTTLVPRAYSLALAETAKHRKVEALWPVMTTKADGLYTDLRVNVMETVIDSEAVVFETIYGDVVADVDTYFLRQGSPLASAKHVEIFKRLAVPVSVLPDALCDDLAQFQIDFLQLADIATYIKPDSALSEDDRYLLLDILLDAPELLSGLPLLQRADGSFVSFGPTHYWVTSDDLDMFSDHLEWFVHPNMVERIKDVPDLSIERLRLDRAAAYAEGKRLARHKTTTDVFDASTVEWVGRFLIFLTSYETQSVQAHCSHLHLLVAPRGHLLLPHTRAPYLLHGGLDEKEKSLLNDLVAACPGLVVLSECSEAISNMYRACGWAASKLTLKSLSIHLHPTLLDRCESSLRDRLQVHVADLLTKDYALWAKRLPVYPLVDLSKPPLSNVRYGALSGTTVLPPCEFLPASSSAAFLDSSFSCSEEVAGLLEIERYSEAEYIKLHLVPNIDKHTSDALVSYIASIYSIGDPEAWTEIQTLLTAARPWVPSISKSGRTGLAKPSNVVLCLNSSAALYSLYRSGESVFLSEKIRNDIRARFFLMQLGMETAVSERVLYNRITLLHNLPPALNNCKDFSTLCSISLQILKLLDTHPTFLADNDLTNAIRHSAWIISLKDGVTALRAPDQCRSNTFAHLVSKTFALVDYKVTSDYLTKLLGWDIPFSALLEQLKYYISEGTEGVHKATDVLCAIALNHPNCALDTLKLLSCIPTSQNTWARPDRTVLRCSVADKLFPHYAVVDTECQEKAGPVLKRLGIPEELSCVQLLDLLDALSDEDASPESAEAGAAAINELAKNRDSIPRNRAIYMPSHTNAFYEISKLEFVSSGPCDAFHAHSDVTTATAFSLGMKIQGQESIAEVLLEDDSVFEDYEQEVPFIKYAQDTIRDYGYSASFREYLCNADDAQASNFQVILDMQEHPAEELCFETLRIFQGPALVFANSATFSARDFEAFKIACQSQRRQDISTIGSFGRGALTMYNWADVIFVVSGSTFMALDPSARFLGERFLRPRRGLKMDLKTACLRYPNQLLPFQDLNGFDIEEVRSAGFYNGTIFRLPLRDGRCSTSFTRLSFKTVEDCFNLWQTEQEASVLFLKNINSVKFIKRETSSTEVLSSLSLLGDDGAFCSRAQAAITDDGAAEIIRFDTSLHTNSSADIKRKWSIVHYACKRSEIPETLRHGQSGHDNQIKAAAHVAIAVELTFVEQPISGLFCYAPISDPQSVWTHVQATHACFALSSDRLTIRFDEADSFPTRWNKFLLTLVPRAYELIMKDTLMSQKTISGLLRRLAAKSHSRESIVTASISAGVFTWMANSTDKIWRHQDGSLHAKSETLFIKSGSFGSTVIKLLKVLKYQAYVTLSRDISLVLEGTSSNFPFCEVQDVLGIIRNAKQAIQSAYSTGRLGEGDFVDLWTYFGSEGEFALDAFQDCLIVPMQNKQLNLFRLNYLLLELTPAQLGELDALFQLQSLDIKLYAISGITLPQWVSDKSCFAGKLNSSRMAALMNVFMKDLRLRPDNERLSICKTLLEVLRKLDMLAILKNELPKLSVIPLIHPIGRTVSYASSGDVIWLRKNFTPLLMAAFEGINGLLIGRLDQLPAELASMLPDAKAESHFKLELQVLRRASIATQELSTYEWTPARSGKVHEFLCKYLKQLSKMSNPSLEAPDDTDLHVLRGLPIWPSASGLRSANQLTMVSSVVDPLAWSWLSDPTLTKYHDGLAILNPHTLNSLHLVQSYLLPNLHAMPPGDEAYGAWLQLLSNLGRTLGKKKRHTHFSPLLLHNVVQNREGAWKPPGTLYSAGNFLFLAVFGSLPALLFKNSDPPIDYSDVESLSVVRFLTRASFQKCCEIVSGRLSQESSSADFLSQARACFEALNQDTSAMHCGGISYIADYSIVPTSVTDIWWQAYQPASLQRGMGSVRQTVLPQYGFCAWSQCCVASVPICRGLEDVVTGEGFMQASLHTRLTHLYFLVSVVAPALDESHVENFLADVDLIYSSLQSIANAENADLKPWKSCKLWLNVSKADLATPNLELLSAAHWCSADKLVFDCERDIGDLRSMQDYLESFGPLLLRAGAHKASQAAVPELVFAQDSVRTQVAAMLDQEDTFDMGFQLDSEEIVRGHKFMLAAGCPVFHSMFYINELSQPTDDQCTYALPDFDVATFKVIREYIYTGKLRLPANTNMTRDDYTDHVDRLLRTILHKSEFLGLPELKLLVFREMARIGLFQFYSVEGLLQDAKDAKCKEMETFCKDYIKEHALLIAETHREVDASPA